jgi:NAD(P)-dependent dehydrogenase (short-subunit alcohol dehydrogenase family)|tara:strand:- start:459 stop:1316 length:858 start_codon:yes stop_codon:yes gene_type:complete
MKVVLVTGCSTGIGLSTATLFSEGDYQVIATARSPESSEELVELGKKDNVLLKTLDVCDQESVDKLFNELNDFDVDVLVNNAGVGGSGSVENASMDFAKNLMETNYFGALRMIQKVIPSMRSRRSGAIINVSSMAGRRPFALMSHYCATKYALNGLSESMAHELARFNIRVTLIEPGTVITPIFGKANSIPEDEENYSILQGRMIRQVTKGLTELGCGPEVIAKCMVDFVTTEDPKLHYLLASDAVDNVDVYQKYGPETWVADGEILDNDEFFNVMKDRYGYEIG